MSNKLSTISATNTIHLPWHILLVARDFHELNVIILIYCGICTVAAAQSLFAPFVGDTENGIKTI